MSVRRWLPVLALIALGGCEQSFRDMYDQSRYKPLAPSPLWLDGRASREPVEGTLPRSAGSLAGASSGRLGVVDAAAPREAVDMPARGKDGSLAPLRPTPAILARGRERFDIFCAPCHSVVGDGDGMIARRGFPHPPSFHSERLRAASDAHFYAVITDGYGAMYPYATRVAPADRLAVIAYIRALQLAQGAPISAVPDAERARLLAEPAAAPGEGVSR